jgi:hypothetical protein
MGKMFFLHRLFHSQILVETGYYQEQKHVSGIKNNICVTAALPFLFVNTETGCNTTRPAITLVEYLAADVFVHRESRENHSTKFFSVSVSTFPTL